MQHLPEQLDAGLFTGWLVWQYTNLALKNQVGKQNADHAQRQRDVGRYVGHGGRLPAQAEDPAVLGAQRQRIAGARRPGRGDNDRDEVQYFAIGRLGPAAG
jgi:hypothetical protein